MRFLASAASVQQSGIYNNHEDWNWDCDWNTVNVKCEAFEIDDLNVA